jgi:ABC-type polysaccharide/polyol phosphate export permease
MAHSNSVYDSAARTSIFRETFKSFWIHRSLIALLVKRDLTVRYKRSFLGLLWSLLNPLLTSLVLWFIFVYIFRPKLPDDTQFAPYLLAGVLTITFFTQGLSLAADSIANGAPILQKIYVPPQVFALAAAFSSAANFFFGLFALSFVTLITGDGFSLLFPLTAVVMLCMLMLVTGLGLMTAILYIRFDDTRNLVVILLSLMTYITPIFYPKEILKPIVRQVVSLNPVTSYLDVFRFVFASTGSATTFDWIYMFVTAIVALLLGIHIFSKMWPKSVVMM